MVAAAPRHRFQRAGIWWVKLTPADPSFGYGDRKGYYPAHVVVGERLLGRRLAGDERVRWLSRNKLDVRPGNLFVERTTDHLLLGPLAAPESAACLDRVVSGKGGA